MKGGFNIWQSYAKSAYGGGDYQHMTSMDEIEHEAGDTLFLFIMRELSDDEGCDCREEALRRMERAKNDISDVLARFYQR